MAADRPARWRNLARLFGLFLYLGCTAFGGPAAHIGYFRRAVVSERGWLSEAQYADLVALCQLMPGPASSQVGIAIGLLRGGYAGSLLAWLGFTLPSALLLGSLAYGLQQTPDAIWAGIVHGLKIVAVAVVAQAVWGMGRQFCRRPAALGLMLAAAAAALLFSGITAQIGIMLAASLAGWRLLPVRGALPAGDTLPAVPGRRSALGWLLLFGLLLVLLPWWAAQYPAGSLPALATVFYRTGALVFGGGHVVLPLLESQTVPLWLDTDAFLSGYGAAQAVPGPLFTLAAFVGTAAAPEHGLLWGGVALAAMFAPSFLLVFGLLPFWSAVSRHAPARAALNGVNAAVVGLLLAALYQPVWLGAIHRPADAALAAAAFALLLWGRLPVWLVVVLTALGGLLLQNGF